MPICKIIDTIPSFLRLWDEIEHRSVDEQIDGWRERYMTLYPELLQKQLDDFASLNEDWRVTASERIFPALPERLDAMQIAHDNLLSVCREFLQRVDQGKDLRPFFGSWFDLRGMKQTGYFLENELITTLQKQMSLYEIALLTDVEKYLRPLLTQIAK